MIEGAPKQTKCNGTLPHDLVPRTLVDLLLKINEPKKRRRFYEEKKGSYRNHVNGDGVCLERMEEIKYNKTLDTRERPDVSYAMKRGVSIVEIRLSRVRLVS